MSVAQRVMPVFTLITGNAARMQEPAPDRASATRLTESIVAEAAKTDPNDVLYWFESSWDYNPEPDLGAMRARPFAVNFADDLINATDLNVMQRLIGKMSQGRYVEMPETAQSYGHQTPAHPEVWKPYLIQFMNGG